MPVSHHKHPIPRRENLQQQDGMLLQVAGLNFAYPDGRQALHDIHFEMQRCEKIALVGPNGAGKSTLILNIHGLLRGEGQVLVSGLPVTEKTLPTIRARVGLVFQNPDDQLFSPTVFEDVAFGPLHMGLAEAEIHRRVEAALAQVGMQEYRDRLSHHLSTGEKKRVAIASVLSMQPDMLILDEPTAGLDPRARRQLITLLDELPIGMLVATHDLWMVKELLPRMIMMDEGSIVADGNTGEILQDTAFLERYGFELP